MLNNTILEARGMATVEQQIEPKPKKSGREMFLEERMKLKRCINRSEFAYNSLPQKMKKAVIKIAAEISPIDFDDEFFDRHENYANYSFSTLTRPQRKFIIQAMNIIRSIAKKLPGMLSAEDAVQLVVKEEIEEKKRKRKQQIK